MPTKIVALLATALLVAALGATAASAHTDADLVAVPAGAEATVELEPTHGCAGSPTTEVAIQAPVAGATAGAVDGWTATATDDGKGHTVLEWTGGSLPADEEGAFPVTFTAPDAVGELLTFPAVQTCESGEELSWISGDPAAEFPAPRLLVLPAGSEPAAELDEVPADAPGRSKLAEIVDVDDPSETTTTVAAATTTTPAAGATTTAPAGPTTTAEPAEFQAPSTEGDDAGGSSTPLVVGGLVVVLLVVGGAVLYQRRRTAAPD